MRAMLAKTARPFDPLQQAKNIYIHYPPDQVMQYKQLTVDRNRPLHLPQRSGIFELAEAMETNSKFSFT